MSLSKRLILFTAGWLFLLIVSIIGFSYYRNIQLLEQENAKIQTQSLAYFRNRTAAQEQTLALYAQQLALNPDIQRAFVRGDRQSLEEITNLIIAETEDITPIHTYNFYLPPGLFFFGKDTIHHVENYTPSRQQFPLAESIFERPKIKTGWIVEDTDGLGLFAAAPIYHQGRLVGAVILVSIVDGATLQNLTAYLPVHWQISLSADVAASHAMESRTQLENEPSDLIFLQALSEYIPIFNTPEAYRTVFEKEEISLNTVQQGGQIFSILSVPISDYENNVVGVLDIVQNRTQENRQQFFMRLSNLLILFGIIATSGVGLAVSINRSIVALEDITQAARLVSEGQYDTLIEIKRDDEIGQLAKVFNQMITHTRDVITRLDQRVQERTQALQRRASLLQATADVGNLLVVYRDMDEIFFQMVRRISDRFGFYHVGIFLLDERKEYAVLRAANSAGGQRMLSRGHRLRVGQVGIVGFAAASKQARIALDVGKDAVYFDNPDLPETRSEMALPILIQGEIVGVLDIQSRQANAFSEEDITVLQGLASQLAIAIENSSLYKQTQEALQKVYLLEEQSARRAWRTLAEEKEISGFVSTMRGITPLPDQNLDDLQYKTITSGKAQISKDGLILAAPVRIRNLVIGVLRLRKHDLSIPWQPNEVDMITILLEQFAAAIENARLYTESQRQAAIESAIDQIANKLTMATDVESVLRETAQALAQYISDADIAVKISDANAGETHDEE